MRRHGELYRKPWIKSIKRQNHKEEKMFVMLQPEEKTPTEELLINIQKPAHQTETYNIKTLKI